LGVHRRLSNSLDGFADLKLTDLSVIGTLGVGAFGKVVLVCIIKILTKPV